MPPSCSAQDPNDYLPVVFTRWQGIELMNYSPFIYSYGQRNIAVYNNQTGTFPPDVTGINLTDWTVGTCAGIWSITGASATDPVGTATLDDITITTSTAANSAVNITNLVVKDVTVGGVPVIS